MKVGDLVRHCHCTDMIGIIIQSMFFDHSVAQKHRVKWFKEGGIVASLRWNKIEFGESVLKVISEA